MLNKLILFILSVVILSGAVFSADHSDSPYAGVAKKLKLNAAREVIPPALLDDPESLSLATLQIFVGQSKFDASHKPAYDAEKNRNQYSYYTAPITSNRDRCFYLYASHRLESALVPLLNSGTVGIRYMGYQKTETSTILKYQLVSTIDVNREQQKPFPYNFTIEYIQKKLVMALAPDQKDKRSILRRQRTLTHLRVGTNDVPQNLASAAASSSAVASSSSEGAPQGDIKTTGKKKKDHGRERSNSDF